MARRSSTGSEISPYTQETLGIAYPQSDVDQLFAAASQSIEPWARLAAEERIGEIKAQAFGEVGAIAEEATSAIVDQLIGAKASAVCPCSLNLLKVICVCLR